MDRLLEPDRDAASRRQARLSLPLGSRATLKGRPYRARLRAWGHQVLPRLAFVAAARSPEEIVEPVLAGPGRDACIRFFAYSIREIQGIDSRRLAVTDIPSSNRFRVVGGIHSACSWYKGMLDVTIDRRGSAKLIQSVEEAGGQVFGRSVGGAVPYALQLGIPPTRVDEFRERLMPTHREFLLSSIEYGSPTHLHEHYPELMNYLLREADRLSSA